MKDPIHILLINGPLPPPYGGVSTYLAHALPYLASNGFIVHTIMDKRPANERQYEEFERSGIHIHYGGGNRWKKFFCILDHLPLWLKLARASRLPLPFLFRTIASQASWIDVAESVVQHYPIDIIHVYDYPWVQGFVGSYIAKKYGKRSVQTTFGEVVPHVEELVQHDAVGKLYTSLVSTILKEFDRVITLSRHCAQELQTVGISADKVRIIGYGIDIRKYSTANDGRKVREDLGIGSRPMVFFLGHIRPRKGPQILLESIPHIARSLPDVLVVFAGPDLGILAQLQERVSNLHMEKNVLFLPAQSDDRIVGLYAACDVFAFPTCTPIECLGLSMVQAMASGKPVVGSNIDGIPEVIVDNETGFLVQPANERELGERLLQLLQDGGLRENMGRAGRRRAEECFDQDALIGELEKLYCELAGR
jgi:glycosyltransferase involved in cell wall biosynthesis